MLYGQLILLAGVCLGTVASHAQDATWLSNPGSGDWNTDVNWQPATAPTGIATFGASDKTAITFSSPSTTVGTLQFSAGAPAYSFSVIASFSSSILKIPGTGIDNHSSNSPTFSLTGNLSLGNSATLNFQGGSTAANSAITNNSGGLTVFSDTSTAGNCIELLQQTVEYRVWRGHARKERGG